jgi:methyltransferase
MRGGREYSSGHFRFMKWMHASWILAMLIEVFVFDRPFILSLAIAAGLLAGVGQLLRYSAIVTLGDRWTVNVMTLPGEKPVMHGIYRYLRHPNYLGVILEIAAFPLIHTAYLTAILFSFLNALIIHQRIVVEEKALDQDCDYDVHFRAKPRLFPKHSTFSLIARRRRG